MSQEHAWPATWRMGLDVPAREARRRAAAAAAAADDGAGAARVLAGLPQAFDACIFGALALGIFPKLFFSALVPAAGVAAAVGVWALAYLAAWASSAVLARRGGRTRSLLAAARLVFAIATVAMAAAPAAAVWAPLVLIALRLVQGLALGVLVSPRSAAVEMRRERLRSGVIVGAIGLAAAGAILGVLALALPSADFMTWGWRFPFVIALALNMGALFGDLRAAEAPPRARRRADLRLVAVSGGLIR